jgi:hypothetical protein
MTASILSTAHESNRVSGITGVLCHGQGLYLQVLEGERSAVNACYAKIVADRRHRDVELLHLEEISERRYPEWFMAHVSLSDVDPMIVMQHPKFDPYSASGAFVLQLVDKLVEAGRRIDMPPV